MLFKKFQGHLPFLSKGPIAIYLGGLDIQSHLSSGPITDPLNYYNFGLVVLLLPVWILFALYKKIRFTGQSNYLQKLRQVILGVGGRENVSRKMIILGQWVLCLSVLGGHFFVTLSMKNKNGNIDQMQVALQGNIFIAFMCTGCCCIPLLGNRAMRYRVAVCLAFKQFSL